MPFEIERRFLVRVDPGAWDGFGPGRELRQGYIRNGTPSVRIRTGEARGPVLTCKSGRGIRRREVEAVVPAEMAQELFAAAEERIIEKRRHRVGPWDVDAFRGDLEGLELMEIELEHEDDPLPPPPEGVKILREVTDDKTFVSGQLARLTKNAKRRLVFRVYGGSAP